MKNERCRLCEGYEFSTVYEGQIRSGDVGSDFVPGYKVLKCNDCGFVVLDQIVENIQEFYETEEYRARFDTQTDIAYMQKKFDPDQNRRIHRIGIENMRNRTVADFGAGPGIFIDAIQSVAGRTIVVEPSSRYREYLSGRGHICFPYAEELLNSGEKVDVAVSFDTIEHIVDVRSFMKNMYDSLVPGGLLVLSMPNNDDIIRQLCKEAYEPFYYQISHVNYFDRHSTERLLKMTGFIDIEMEFLHKYNIGNLLQWYKSGKPGNVDTGLVFDRAFKEHYAAEIERLGIASHIFVRARKKGVS